MNPLTLGAVWYLLPSVNVYAASSLYIRRLPCNVGDEIISYAYVIHLLGSYWFSMCLLLVTRHLSYTRKSRWKCLLLAFLTVPAGSQKQQCLVGSNIPIKRPDRGNGVRLPVGLKAMEAAAMAAAVSATTSVPPLPSSSKNAGRSIVMSSGLPQ